MRTLLVAAFAGAIALTATATASVGLARSATASKYFKCGSGYTFQSSGEAVRCYKPAREQHAELMPCGSMNVAGINVPVPLYAKADHSGNTDYCAGQAGLPGVATNTVAVVRTCPAGYAKRTQSGKDVCFKTIPAEVIPPTTEALL